MFMANKLLDNAIRVSSDFFPIITNDRVIRF